MKSLECGCIEDEHGDIISFCDIHLKEYRHKSKAAAVKNSEVILPIVVLTLIFIFLLLCVYVFFFLD